MEEFFSWEMLATFAGAVTATVLLTQLVKNVFKNMPTQAVSYIIALALLIGVTAVNGQADWAAWAIVPLNAALVSLSANGGYSAVQRVKNGKPEE